MEETKVKTMTKTASKWSFYLLIVAVLFGSVFIGGCTTQPPTEPPTSVNLGTPVYFDPGVDIDTLSFASSEELQAFIKTYQQSGYYGGYRGGVMYKTFEATMDGAASAPSPGSGMPVSESAAVDYSQTNNQVTSVDEADIIKTDGEYIYTVSGNTVFIIKAYPGDDAAIISRISLEETPGNIFVSGKYLAVFGNYYKQDVLRKAGITPRNGFSFFYIYDLSDKENPILVKDYKFEGNYFEARMYGDYVYFMTTSGLQYRGDYPTPLIMETGSVKAMPVDSIRYFPIPYQNPQFLNIHSVKITDPNADLTSESMVVEGSQNLYMSENSIYVTYTEYINEWELRSKIVVEFMQDKLTDADKALVAKIKASDDEVVPPEEKEQKILQIVESYFAFMDEDEQQAANDAIDKKLEDALEAYEYMEYTIIHKINVLNGNIDVAGSGKVPGHVVNQFSLDEFDGILRIATTVSQRWDRKGQEQTKSKNMVFALDDGLEIIGSLQGLAQGEQIYSTRFMGDRLYMVTFRQVDPFFVIDLSNPLDIKELGELKIPGFSRYLHPYDENTIIGIGRDATDEGRQKGIKISLFDVSDVANPKEVAKFATKDQYAQSAAEWEHKAFLFSKDKELLVIPAYSYNWEKNSQKYNGAMVFHITKDDISLRGIIDHSKGTSDQWYSPQVERSLYIEELLYTKSPGLLRINEIDDLGSVKSIELNSTTSGPYPVY